MVMRRGPTGLSFVEGLILDKNLEVHRELNSTRRDKYRDKFIEGARKYYLDVEGLTSEELTSMVASAGGVQQYYNWCAKKPCESYANKYAKQASGYDAWGHEVRRIVR